MDRLRLGILAVFFGAFTCWALPARPTLQSPLEGDCPERRPIFKWTPSIYSEQYLLRITHNGSLYLEKKTRRPMWVPKADLPEGVYEVRVAGYDGTSYGKWSLPVHFRRVFAPALASINGLESDGGDIELVAGPGIAIDPDPTNLTLLISATDVFTNQAVSYAYRSGNSDYADHAGSADTAEHAALAQRAVTSDVAVVALNAALPVGTVLPYAGNAAPSGYFLCDGSSLSSLTYPELFTVIGTNWGVGDGTLDGYGRVRNYKVPDMRGRVVAGKDDGQSEFNPLGKSGGTKTHVLSIGEMPSHSHSVSGKAMDSALQSVGPLSYNNTTYTTWDTSPAGGGQAHNNLQPYGVMNYIIKY